jgi:hypothetical protein
MPSPQTKWEQSVDRAMRSCTRVFGENQNPDGSDKIQYVHHGGGVRPYFLDGIFEATTETVDIDTGATVMSNQPRVSFAMSLLQAMPGVNDQVIIRGVTYRVVEPSFDGQGTVALRLHVVPSER